MEWWVILAFMLGGLILLMTTGIPVAFAFMLVCIIGSYLFWGGFTGIELLGTSFFSAIARFAFLPIPLFVLMGDIIFESGVGVNLVNAVDSLMGRTPGRLNIIAVGAGTLLGSMIGISGASIAILGQSMYPEMAKRGYSKSMSLGAIVITGALATLIPPSATAIVLGTIGQISIGELLMAIVIPGVIVGVLSIAYIIIRCGLDKSLAPGYELVKIPVRQKLMGFVRHILPTAIIIFAVIGSIFLGVATPSEAAALGVVACYIVAAINGSLSWKMVKKSALSTARISVMVLFIVVFALSFGRILSTSGALQSFIDTISSLSLHPVVILLITQAIILVLGCFMETGSILMITVPLFVPLAIALGFNVVWYGVILLINLQLALITPPFGMDVFTMKAISPSDVTVGQIFRSALPFLGIGYLAFALVWIFPQLALWLPSMMAK